MVTNSSIAHSVAERCLKPWRLKSQQLYRGLMGIPSRDLQEYSRVIMFQYEDTGRYLPIILLLYSWGIPNPFPLVCCSKCKARTLSPYLEKLSPVTIERRKYRQEWRAVPATAAVAFFAYQP